MPPPAAPGAAGKLISSGFLAIAYGSVGLSFAGFGLGQRGDSGDSTRDFSTALIQSPLGVPALVGLGLTIMGIGVYFIVKGFGKKFKEELQHFEGTRRGRVISALGVTGHVSKGLALILTGLLFVVAAATNNPGSSTGLDGSLKALRDHPFGPIPAPGDRGGLHCLRRVRAGPGALRPDVAAAPDGDFLVGIRPRDYRGATPGRAGTATAAGLAEVWHELRSGEQAHPPTAP